MAQEYITLEEAAQILGMTPSQLKWKLREEWGHVRTFRDGATLRVSKDAVTEIARSIGQRSDPDVLSRPAAPAAEEPPLFAEEVDAPLALTPEEEPSLPPRRKADGTDSPLILTPEEEPSLPPQRRGDGSDSDVRVEKIEKEPRAGSADVTSEEEIVFEIAEAPPSGSASGSGRQKPAGSSSGVLKSRKTGDTGKLKKPAEPVPPEEDSSEFELTLEPDSDSDFQLELTGDSSEEVSLGELPVTPGGSGSKRSGDSGINLHKPSDSGVLLEKSPVKEPESSSDDEVDFELSLDVSSSSSRVSGGRPSSKNLKKEVEEEDSSGEFELTLDDSDEAAALQDQASGEEGQDIFETDFEIPALEDESASEAIALDDADTDLETSDFDLALDESDVGAESGSEVVVLEDEDVEAPSARRPGRRVAVAEEVAYGEDLEEGPSASRALRGVRAVEEEEEEYAEAAPAKWGALPVVMLIPTVLVLFVAGLMGYELLHNMWGYHQPAETASPLVTGLADMLDMAPKQQ